MGLKKLTNLLEPLMNCYKAKPEEKASNPLNGIGFFFNNLDEHFRRVYKKGFSVTQCNKQFNSIRENLVSLKSRFVDWDAESQKRIFGFVTTFNQAQQLWNKIRQPLLVKYVNWCEINKLTSRLDGDAELYEAGVRA